MNLLHFKYIIAILAAVIIILITYDFGDNKRLVEYTSFALTITSLVLAIVSITYSFYSNSSLTKHLSLINKAADIVSDSSEQISYSTQKIDNKIDLLPSHFQNLEGKVDNSNALIQKILLERESFAENRENLKIPTEILKELTINSSIMGLQCLYIVCIAYKSSIPFRLDEIEKKLQFIHKEYMYGFLVACSSIGIFSREDFSDNWVITFFNEEFIELLEKSLLLLEESSDETTSVYLKSNRVMINEYFSAKEASV